MEMIEIVVAASIFPPTDQLYIGGTNPRIFSGEFTLNIPEVPEFPQYWTGAERVRVGGISVIITGRSPNKKKLFGKTYLTSTSKEHFEQLESQGWKLCKSAAKDRKYPSDT